MEHLPLAPKFDEYEDCIFYIPCPHGKETKATWMLICQACSYSMDCSYDGDIHFDSKDRRDGERSSLKNIVGKIREQVNLHIIVIFHHVLLCYTGCSMLLLIHVNFHIMALCSLKSF